jgi:hypothetical protein
MVMRFNQEGVAIEVAEAVIGALKGELAATAVNAPMVTAEVIISFKPLIPHQHFTTDILCMPLMNQIGNTSSLSFPPFLCDVYGYDIIS